MKEFRFVVPSLCVAAALWFVMFSPWTSGTVPFWIMMPCSSVILTVITTLLCKEVWRDVLPSSWKDVALGIAGAVFLWGVFWIGDKLSGLMFDFARPQVNGIYEIKNGVSPVVLSVLMLFVIGPAEEIFWRGFVQRRMQAKIGLNAGFVITTLVYALVHLPSMNFMLVMAALVAGAAWGLAYRFFPGKFSAIVISHAIWDAAVFLWFPI